MGWGFINSLPHRFKGAPLGGSKNNAISSHFVKKLHLGSAPHETPILIPLFHRNFLGLVLGYTQDLLFSISPIVKITHVGKFH